MQGETAQEPALPDDAAFAEIRRLLNSSSREAALRLRALLQQAEQQRQPWHRAFATVGLAFSSYVYNADAALAQARAALLQMQALQTRVGQSLAWNAIGLAHRERGEMAESVAALEQMLELERQLGYPIRRAHALNNLSLTLERVGRSEAALACQEEALGLLPPEEDLLRATLHNNMANSLATRARGARDDGQPRAQWQPLAERALRLARELVADIQDRQRAYPGNPQYPRGCLAKALVVLDEVDEALPLLHELQQVYTADGDLHALLFVRLELARAWLQAGQPVQARAVAQQAIALARERHFASYLQDLWLVVSQACQALAEWQPALEAFQAYHGLRLHVATQLAEERARSLAVRLDTARAVRESRVDALTGLLNRRGFEEVLAAELEHASQDKPLRLLLMDLDHFKAVNDQDGHARGDQALVLLGTQLKRAGRAHDHAARLGGDEFAWFGRLQAEQALKVAQRIQRRLRAQSAELWPDRPPLTLSIGIAEADQAGFSADLLRRADAALYAAKAAGRDCVRCAEPAPVVQTVADDR